jgi:hypothetical protein
MLEKGAPSFRVSCERVGSMDLKVETQRSIMYGSEVPALAKNARTGHPLSWRSCGDPQKNREGWSSGKRVGMS